MIYGNLSCFTPGRMEVIPSVLPVNGTSAKLVGGDQQRCFLMITPIIGAIGTAINISLNGDRNSNGIIAVTASTTVNINWWTHGAIVTQELWVTNLIGPVTFSIIAVRLLPANRSNINAAERYIANVSAQINGISQTRGKRSYARVHSLFSGKGESKNPVAYGGSQRNSND